MVNSGDENIEKLKDGGYEEVVQDMIDHGFKVRYAWYPTTPVLCEVVGAIEALVIILEVEKST